MLELEPAPVLDEGLGADVEAAVDGGLGVGSVVDIGLDVAVDVEGDTGARLTTQVPWTEGSGSEMRAASRSEVTYPSDVT